MQNTTLPFACAVVCALATPALAQEGMGPPKPAPELKKLEPLIGNWAGSGVFNDPDAPPIHWKCQAGYRWSHGGFWVQEDFTIHFDGMDQPMVFRAYLGWDGERERYVNAHIANNGEVGLDEFVIGPDGAMVTMMTRQVQGNTFCERAVSKVDGDKMTMKIEFLLAEGPSMTAVEGEFQRVDQPAPEALGAGKFGPPAHEAMAPLGKGAGVYAVKGSMTYAPGVPPMKIHGTDEFAMIFGGSVMHGHTVGGSDAMPGEYVGDVFWGWDAKAGCYASVFVSNMGEVGTMEMRYSADRSALISTSASTKMGRPLVQRFVLHLDDSGAFMRGVGHSLMGSAPPIESFNATYERKKKT